MNTLGNAESALTKLREGANQARLHVLLHRASYMRVNAIASCPMDDDFGGRPLPPMHGFPARIASRSHSLPGADLRSQSNTFVFSASGFFMTRIRSSPTQVK